MSCSLLLVGLGNRPFPNTRHSIGHLILDALAARLAIPTTHTHSLPGRFGNANVVLGDTPVDLALFTPEPLMNLTGPAVAAAFRHIASPLVIVHDSLQHKPMSLSVKFGGSANGHNGVRSVIRALGDDPNFYRFRIGIGRDGDAASYVLGRLSPQEIDYWSVGAGLDRVCDQLASLVFKPPV